MLAGVPDVDVSRPRDIEAFVADVARAAKASRHYDLATTWDRFIDNAELSVGSDGAVPGTRHQR